MCAPICAGQDAAEDPLKNARRAVWSRIGPQGLSAKPLKMCSGKCWPLRQVFRSILGGLKWFECCYDSSNSKFQFQFLLRHEKTAANGCPFGVDLYRCSIAFGTSRFVSKLVTVYCATKLLRHLHH